MKFIDYLKQRSYARRTISNVERSALDFLAWLDGQGMEVEQVAHRDVLAYIKYHQNKGVTQQSIKGYILAVKHFYAFQVANGTVKTNPVQGIKLQGIKRQKLYHTFRAEELNAIYNRYDPSSIEKIGGRGEREHFLIESRNKVMLGLYVYQGVQTAELIRLEVDHVKLREGKIEVPGTKRSDTRFLQLEAHQVLDVYDYVLQLRKEILSISEEETDQLFVSPKGGKDQSNYVYALMRELKRQNKQVENAQQLRTSVIVKWLRQYNLREVQYRAGHRYVSSTENYLANETEVLSEQVNQYHPLG